METPCRPSSFKTRLRPVMLVDVRAQTRDELAVQFGAWDLPSYRLNQLLQWLYPRRAESWDEMTNLPKELRQQLQQTYALQPLQLVRRQGSHDTTQKYLWKLTDGSLVESV